MFNWSMAYALQSELQRNGCQCTMFPFRDGYRKHPEFSDFPGLEYAVGQGGLHGLISIADFFPDKLLSGLENAGLQLCFSGSPALADCGVFIDTVGFMLESARKAAGTGIPFPARAGRARSAASLQPSAPRPVSRALAGMPGSARRSLSRGLRPRAWPGRRPGTCWLAPRRTSRLHGAVRRHHRAGLFFGARPPAGQPHRLHARPGFCLRNRNAPIDFPCRDVVNYEVDCRRIAELTVRMLLTRLRTGSGEPAVQWLLPAPEKTAAE